VRWLDDDPEAEVERAKYREGASTSVERASELISADARPPEFSDEALALEFARRHADDLRFVAARSKWFLWTRRAWHADDTLRAFDLARAVCRSVSASVGKGQEKLAAAIASAKTVAAVVTLARTDRCLVATVDQWDADPWLLNTSGGTSDLRTGAMGPHRREDYCTKITAAAPEGSCPTWLRFLDRIMGGNADLISYLQRVIGYSLTGITREHALFFGHGTGANGKSVFIETVAGMLGDYAVAAPMETFIASQAERHPTDLAGLHGARLVSAQETEQGRRWAESKIKTLTGGDRISARFMRQNFFEFTPQFKLLIAGNHKPGLRSVDEAIRRRFHLIPFAVTIPEAERDTELPEKLQLEWPGILAWAIQGCLEWQRIGLAPPCAVRVATEAYLAAEDAIALWIDERCICHRSGTTRSTALFADWKPWAEARGEFVGSQKRFSQAIEDRGFVSFKDSRTRQAMFQGIALRP
jgi:putative DNA primase/helicase